MSHSRCQLHAALGSDTRSLCSCPLHQWLCCNCSTGSPLDHCSTHNDRLLFAVTGIDRKLLLTSPLGEWNGLLQAIHRLTSIKPIARALTQSSAWLGSMTPAMTLKPDEGRQVLLTLLGPAFSLAVLPDPQWRDYTRPMPNVGEQCFSDYQSRRPSDIMGSMQSLRLTMSSVVDSLHNISMNFLRNQVRPLGNICTLPAMELCYRHVNAQYTCLLWSADMFIVAIGSMSCKVTVMFLG